MFNKNDMMGGYHHIIICLGDGWETTLKARDDHSNL